MKPKYYISNCCIRKILLTKLYLTNYFVVALLEYCLNLNNFVTGDVNVNIARRKWIKTTLPLHCFATKDIILSQDKICLETLHFIVKINVTNKQKTVLIVKEDILSVKQNLYKPHIFYSPKIFLVDGLWARLNISEWLKTNEIPIQIVSGIFWKKHLVTIRKFLSVLNVFEYGKKQGAFYVFSVFILKHTTRAKDSIQ